MNMNKIKFLMCSLLTLFCMACGNDNEPGMDDASGKEMAEWIRSLLCDEGGNIDLPRLAGAANVYGVPAVSEVNARDLICHLIRQEEWAGENTVVTLGGNYGRITIDNAEIGGVFYKLSVQVEGINPFVLMVATREYCENENRGGGLRGKYYSCNKCTQTTWVSSSYDSNCPACGFDGTVSTGDEVRIGDFFYSDGSHSTLIDKDKTVIGIVFEVDKEHIGSAEKEYLGGDDHVHGLVMSVKRLWKFYEWGKTGDISGIANCASKEMYASDISGLGNTQKIKAADSDLSDYPAFRAVEEWNQPGNENCPPSGTTGWFIPSIAQWHLILHNLGTLKEWDEAYFTTHAGWFTGKQVGGVNRIDALIGVAASWDAPYTFGINSSNSLLNFWSSSEISNNQALRWGMSHSDGLIFTGNTDKSSQRMVRPVLAF